MYILFSLLLFVFIKKLLLYFPHHVLIFSNDFLFFLIAHIILQEHEQVFY